MLARNPRSSPRPLEEIARLIEAYPPDWRRWCNSPERGGCACMGCVRQPAPATARGDPEYAAWPDERDALIEQEVALYHAARSDPDPSFSLTIRTGKGSSRPWPSNFTSSSTGTTVDVPGRGRITYAEWREEYDRTGVDPSKPVVS